MKFASAAIAAVITVGAGTAALAAETAQPATGLEEIVVTATKQASKISDTAAAISAISAESLGGGGIQNILDLSAAVPNLSVGDQFGVNRTFIRGVGLTSIDLGADGAVAFLQNEAVIARPAEQLTGFYDLDHVEVLRGPQGTTYGRGATAGVVNLVTKKPTDKLDGYATVTLGNYRSKTFEGAVGGPLSDRVSVRIAGKAEKHDGYGTNLFTGNPVDDRNAYAMRASVRVKASDTVTVDLVGDWFDENDFNYGFHYFGPTVTTDAGIPARLFGGTTIFDHGGDIRNIWSRTDATNKRHGGSGTAIVDWKPGDFEFKSISSWRHFVRFNQDDLGVSDARFFGQNNYNEESTSYSQEFTVSTTQFGIDWLAGAMYFHEKNPGSVRVPLTNLFAYVTGLQCSPNVPAAPPCSLLDNANYLQSGTVTTNAEGVYLQGSKEIAHNLKLTLGARFNNEKRQGVGSFEFDVLTPPIVPTDKEKSWNAVTPKFLLEYRLGGGELVYGSVTRGFKSGVINIGSSNDVIDPEYVTAYETGFKTKFWDNRATFSAAAFYYDYTNLQVGFVNAQSVVQTVNAAKARNFGLELESEAKLTDQLTGDVAVTYLNAKYKEFLQGDYRQNFKIVDLSGNTLTNAPTYSGHLGLTYTVPLAALGKVAVHAETTFSDRVYFTEFNNADASQGSYALLNANVRYESPDNHWSVTGWIRNATDKLVEANNIITAPLYQSVRVGTLMPPRTFGVSFGVKF